MTNIGVKDPSQKKDGGSDNAPKKTDDQPKVLDTLDDLTDFTIKRPNTDLFNAELFERGIIEGGHKLKFIGSSNGKSLGKITRCVYWIKNRSHIWEECANINVFTQLLLGVSKRMAQRLKAVYKKNWKHFHKTDRDAARNIKDKKIGWLKGNQNIARINAAYKVAQTIDRLSIDTHDLNKDPLLVATAKDCYYDLREGKTIPVDDSFYITKKLGAEYDIEATCPMWDQFRKQVLLSPYSEDGKICYDPDYDLYMQKQMGYTLTGLTDERTFLNFHGDGTNGKSIFWRVIKEVMGSYAAKVDKSIIEKSGMGGSDASKASPWLAHLVGLRLAILDEPPSGMRLDLAAFKTLVSSDTLHFRRLHCSPEEAEPTAKFILAGNHEPNVDNPDKAFSNRWKTMKFLNSFDDKEDGLLFDKLTTEKEKSGILNWMIEGWRMAKEDRKKYGKIQMPKCVREWGKTFVAQEDLLGHFLEDCCVIGEGDVCSQRMLSVAFTEWNKQQGYKGITPITLGKRMRERKGIEEGKSGIELWKGVSIKPELFGVQYAVKEGTKDLYPRFTDIFRHDRHHNNNISDSVFYWWCKSLIKSGELTPPKEWTYRGGIGGTKEEAVIGVIGDKEHAVMLRYSVAVEKERY